MVPDDHLWSAGMIIDPDFFHSFTVEQPIAGKRSWWQLWTDNLGALVFGSLIAGIATGLFFGPYCSFLSILGEVFVGLLRMTVLPNAPGSLPETRPWHWTG